MEKFIAIPVTSEQTQLISATDIILIEQASTTTVTVQYKAASASGDILTLTHAAAGAGDETMRDWLQNAVVSALSSTWSNVRYVPPTPPYACSGIALA